MEDFKISNMPKFKDNVNGVKCNVKRLTVLTNEIIQCFEDEQRNFCRLCYSLLQLRNLFDSESCYLYSFKTEDSSYSFERYLNHFFGLDVRYVERCIKCYQKFMKKIESDDVVGVSIILLPEFQNFSKSKLFELLSVSFEQLLKDLKLEKLNSDMTVKQIREYVKSLKGTEKKENQVLEEPTQEDKVEIDYNPNKHHDRKYFESLSKEELVEIVLQLQDCYESLLEDDDE